MKTKIPIPRHVVSKLKDLLFGAQPPALADNELSIPFEELEAPSQYLMTFSIEESPLIGAAAREGLSCNAESRSDQRRLVAFEEIALS